MGRFISLRLWLRRTSVTSRSCAAMDRALRCPWPGTGLIVRPRHSRCVFSGAPSVTNARHQADEWTRYNVVQGAAGHSRQTTTFRSAGHQVRMHSGVTSSLFATPMRKTTWQGQSMPEIGGTGRGTMHTRCGPFRQPSGSVVRGRPSRPFTPMRARLR